MVPLGKSKWIPPSPPKSTTMKNCATIEELVLTACNNLHVMSPRDVSAFWMALSKIFQNKGGRPPRTNELRHCRINYQLNMILVKTMENIGGYNCKDLATTALGMAKIVKQVGHRQSGKKDPTDSLNQVLHDLLIGIDSRKKNFIFNEIATSSIPIVHTFDPRHLSNYIYAHGLVEFVPNIGRGRTLFDVLALEAISKLRRFNSQNLSNMLWAYAKVGSSNSSLFKATEDSIVSLHDLVDFWPQALSNIAWAVATAGESHPQLFQKLAVHIVSLKDLSGFNSQDLANIAWAYATAGEFDSGLFKHVAGHMVALKDLSRFTPQEMSNISWAYATMGESNPQLFKRFADHIIALNDLKGFNTQNLSNIMWAYATAGESHLLLFQRLVDGAIARCEEFGSQEVANFLWAFAIIGHADRRLFLSFAPIVKSKMGEYNSQGLANIGWAYAVANVAVPSLFSSDFIAACLAKEKDFSEEGFAQLHQWQLWQAELKSDVRLPPSLRDECLEAFTSQPLRSSYLQADVMFELSSIGLRPEVEFLTRTGYRLDALVEVKGTEVGIEVDGPSHFVGRGATGRTLLKRRQMSSLDEISIVSVPYWEWNDLGKDRGKKQEYLRTLLRFR